MEYKKQNRLYNTILNYMKSKLDKEEYWNRDKEEILSSCNLNIPTEQRNGYERKAHPWTTNARKLKRPKYF